MDKWADFQASIDVNFVGVVFHIYHILSRFVLSNNHNMILYTILEPVRFLIVIVCKGQ